MGCDNLSWQDCALATKQAIDASATPTDAMQAYGDWTAAYRRVYDANEGVQQSPSDTDRLEDFVRDKLGKYTDPADLALDLALARYLPTLAAILSFPEGAIAIAI